MQKVLVSSCLLGHKVRYNGRCLSISDSDLDWLQSNFELVVFCPEVSAGLSIPRAPAEITGGTGFDVLKGAAKVVGNDSVDVTTQFVLGAQKALELCQQHKIKYAVLTEGSPSCGSSMIYDGTFSGIKKRGSGVTTVLLEREGVKVFNQHSIDELRNILKKLP